MAEADYEMTLRGVRGSMPVAGDQVQRYGGHTPCVELDMGATTVVFDCGTGVRTIAPRTPGDYHVFITHYHSDHLQGLPFFRPLYDAGSRFTFYGAHWEGMSVEDALGGTFRPPWFPIRLEETPAEKRYVELAGQPIHLGDLTITYDGLAHPQGVLAYRIEHDGRSIVIATDTERGDPASDAALNRLAHNADVLIHDAQYTPEEYRDDYEGWGHSTWEHAAEAALASGARRLILTSHDPERTDDAVDAIVALARHRFAAVEAGYEGLVLEI